MYLFASPRSDRTVYITESQMFDLLLEAASLDDIHEKYYSNIPMDDFRKVIESDPTYNSANSQKMGKYGKWLLGLYRNGALKIEDLYKATECLSAFHRYNGKLEKRDINQYRTVNDLYGAVLRFIEDPNQAATKSEEIRNIKSGAEKVYEDEKWLVIVPHTEEAACYYGKGTRWCTAAEKSDNRFENYNENGFLYINILKGTDTKYQFHFESGSFMDATDTPINAPIAETIGLTPELVEFYQKKYPYDSDLLTKKYDQDSLFEISGLNGYCVIFPSYNNNYRSMLLKYNSEIDDYDLVYECYETQMTFQTECLNGRYIYVKANDSHYANNLFDMTNNSLVFSDDDDIVRVNNNTSQDYVICYKYGWRPGRFTENVEKKCLYSLKERKFVTDEHFNDAMKSSSNMWQLCAVEIPNNYDSDLFVFSQYNDETYSDDVYGVYNAQTGKEIIPLTNCGSSKGWFRIQYNGVLYGFLHLGNNVVLYDGSVVNWNYYRRNQDEIIQKYCQGGGNIINEAMKPGFNVQNLSKVFHNLEDAGYNLQDIYWAIKSLCTKNFGEPIGQGSSRIVYQIDDNRVLKLAGNNRGIAQNKAEVACYEKGNNCELFPKIFDKSADDLWIDCEFVLPAEENDFKQCTGITWNELYVIILDLSRWGCLEEYEQEEIRQYMEKVPLVSELYKYIVEDNMVAGDVKRICNWGMTCRNGVARMVLLDSGLTWKILNDYYRCY